MEKEYLNKLKANWKVIVFIVIVALILGLGLSVAQPLKYRASVELLVIQKQDQAVDAYTAIKSAERLSNNLAQVIYTTSFFDKVMNAGFGIENTFSPDEITRRKEWRKMIDTQVAQETGMLQIDVYHADKTQAAEIARAIAYILATKGDEYHGAGKSVTVKTVDSVLLSRYPVRPNIPINLFTSLVLGLLAGGAYVIMKTEKGKIATEFAREAVVFGKEDEKLVVREADMVVAPVFNQMIDENIVSEKKENKFWSKEKPSDGIWTMYDFIPSAISPSNNYWYDGERLELAPEMVS